MGSAAHAGQVPEFFVSCLSHIEVMGGVSRHVLAVRRTVGSKVIYVPAVHIIFPNSAVPDAVQKVTQAMAIDLIGTGHQPLN